MNLRKLKHDQRLVDLIEVTDSKTLAIWAKDCVMKYMYLLEDNHKEEKRPQQALEILDKWLNDEIKMWDARKYTYPCLKAAKELEETDKVACQISRAVSHTLATCHVKTHSEGSAMYVISALYYKYKDDKNVDDILEEERNWQIEHLIEIKKTLTNS